MIKKIIALIVFFITMTAALYAQIEDFGVWFTSGIEKKHGKWNFGAEGELRTKDNANQIDRWSMKFETSYNLYRFLQFGGSYEYIYFHDLKYSNYQQRHRSYAFLQGKYKFRGFTFSVRERLQVTKKDDSDRIKKNGEVNTYAINPEWTWRNRFKLSYNIPKFQVTPSISFESFYQLNNPDGNTFDKLRYTLSFSYNLTKHHLFEIYGLIDKDINVTDPVKTYILGFGYEFSF
jgi:hypothetical protein